MQFQLCVDIAAIKDGTEYYAFAPAFKGLHVFGNTEKDALKNAKDAIIAYVASLLKHNEPIPCCKIIDEDMFPDNFDFKKHLHHTNIPIQTNVSEFIEA